MQMTRRYFCELSAISALSLPANPALAKAKKTTISASGGGEFPRDMLKRTIRAAGGSKARILISPYAANDPKKAFEFAKRVFRDAGANRVSLLPLNKSAIKLADEADAIWFSGGIQNRQMAALSRVGGLISQLQKAHQAGTAMIGGSAGAAVMSRLMISGGSSGTAYTRAGLGFLNKIVLDQHVIARKREWRLRQVISNNRSHLGIGIDESTGVLIEGSRFKVYGRSKVLVSKWSGGKLVEWKLRRGDRFDLRNREPI